MVQSNDRVALDIKIMKYRALARQAPDPLSADRIKALIAELEQKQRETDEWPCPGPFS